MKNWDRFKITARKCASATVLLTTLGLTSNIMAKSSSVSDIKAVFRGGQTFITWKEISGTDVRYNIYRHTRSIGTSQELKKAVLIGEVGDASSLNASASFKWSETRDKEKIHTSSNPVYYVISEGQAPLTDDTGLFVYTVREEADAYYAVTAVVNGREKKKVKKGENATRQAVEEGIIPPEPVLQSKTSQYEDYVHWVDNVGIPGYEAMSEKTGVAYNFRVFFPTQVKMEPGVPLNVFLHGSGQQYNSGTPWRRDEKLSLSLRLDSPVIRGKLQGGLEKEYPNWGWYGSYNKDTGESTPYSMRRVMWTINWVESKFKTNPEQVALRGASMGGIGTLLVGLLNPEKFSVLHSQIPPLPGEDSKYAALGFSPAKYIAEHPEVDFPFIIINAGRTDHVVKFMDKVALARTLEDQKRGYIFYWDLRPHTGKFKETLPDGFTLPPIYWGRKGGKPMIETTRFRRDQSFPALANLSVNENPGTVEFAVEEEERPAWDTEGAGDFIGTFNGHISWDNKSIIDKTDQYQITLQLQKDAPAEEATADITFRRLQQFTTKPNTSYKFVVSDLASKETLQQGEVSSDASGLITIPNLTIRKGKSRVQITE